MLLSEKKQMISSPEDIARVLQAMLAADDDVGQGREHFWVIGLNVKNVIQYVELASLGVLDSTLIHPREIFRMAIAKGVHAIVLGHNHPSGDLTPSAQDIQATRRLEEAGTLLGIRVMDHVIIGNGIPGWNSYAANRWGQ